MGLDQAKAASEPGLAQPVMTLDQMGNNGKLVSYCALVSMVVMNLIAAWPYSPAFTASESTSEH